MQSIHIMGILNLTPDSFYAGSRVAGADALSRARRMWADGIRISRDVRMAASSQA